MADDNSNALRELQRQMAKINESINRLSGESITPLFQDFATLYLGEKMNNPTLRASTKEAFRQHVKNHLIPAFGLQPLDKINNPMWLTWVVDTRKAGRLTRFFNSRKGLVEILAAAKERGLIDKTPKLDNPDEYKNVGRAVHFKEIIKILRNTKDPFYRFFFFCLWKTGCRPREILKWEWSMVGWSEPGESWIDIPGRITKTGRSRAMPIHRWVSMILYKQYLAGNGSIYVFPHKKNPQLPTLNYSFAWKAAKLAAGVDAVPYDMRRSFITACARENKAMITVSQLLDTSMDMIRKFYAKEDMRAMKGILK